MSSATRHPGFGTGSARSGSPGGRIVLILSADPVAAALLGAMVETLGYLVRFYHPPGDPGEAMRRTRPAVAMLDCEDPSLVSEELLGRARMRGISVILFGTREALDGLRALAAQHDLGALLMPATLDHLDEALRRAIEKAC